ncbi:hypothetical protein CDAR_98851 [Caerostris darwini]|uniref:Uncharacterized protein n=1 Tax=Caerostris darwini TaxID=1538125 RepID=A0AAV4Q741_9ARAC|nr:hypothetical protein CDAR_98851 [Caerostris darwini]
MACLKMRHLFSRNAFYVLDNPSAIRTFGSQSKFDIYGILPLHFAPGPGAFIYIFFIITLPELGADTWCRIVTSRINPRFQGRIPRLSPVQGRHSGEISPTGVFFGEGGS